MNTKHVRKLGRLHMPHISLSLQPQSLGFLFNTCFALRFLQSQKVDGVTYMHHVYFFCMSYAFNILILFTTLLISNVKKDA